MTKRQVILRAMARNITWDQAAEILGMSTASMCRLRTLYECRGYDGFWARADRRTRPAVSFTLLEKALLLYKDKYSGLDIRSFHQVLKQRHSIYLSYDCLRQALHDAGLRSRISAV
jgi:hypothetical protein